MNRSVVIVGAGGHGLVLAEALRLSGVTVLGFADPEAAGEVGGLPILGDDTVLDRAGGYDLVNGLGWTGTEAGRGRRQAVQARLEGLGFRFVGARHPSAVIARDVTVADDVQLMAGCIVQPGAVLDRGVIVNSGAIVEHGVHLGAFTHCASGAILCGDVRIGADAHVGGGAVVRQGVTLEDGVVVGAGAVVISAGTGSGALVGVPAQRRGLT